MKNCQKHSKYLCSICPHFDHCDIASRCDGNCGHCDIYSCENNPRYKKSTTAGRMPKSGGDKIMVEQNSVQEKIDYYSKRVNNPQLTEGQRKHAAKRLNQLMSGNKKGGSKPKHSGNFTDSQKQAFHAGAAYGLAKSGREMNVRPENQESFKNGVKAGRAGKYAKK